MNTISKRGHLMMNSGGFEVIRRDTIRKYEGIRDPFDILSLDCFHKVVLKELI